MSEITQTYTSFKNKWEKNSDLIFRQTLSENSNIFEWITTRNGFKNSSEFKSWIKSKKRILDAGCGNGRVTALMAKYITNDTKIVGVDLTAAHVARANNANNPQLSFEQADLLGDLKRLGKFDLIYCQEVLHHTKNPKQAFFNLIKLLEPDGEIAIYVYRKKAPVREFVDDYIRNQIESFTYEDAIKSMEGLTSLGKTLSELKIKITVDDIELLKIPAGEYDLQRFIYHFFLKCFWNPELKYDENKIINYDWYHPQLCSRHTMEEVLGWCEAANLKLIHQYEDEYGITLRGKSIC